MTQIVIADEYGYVVFAAIAIIVECFVIGGTIGSYRKRFFPKEFMEKEFGEEHKKYFGTEIGQGGYPDMGNGLYSRKLSYQQWYEFNVAQRTHLNFVENIGLIIPLVLIAGLVLSVPAAILGATYFLGRLLYTIGYRSGGPKGREIGAVLAFLSLFGELGLAMYTGITFIKA
jgi:uncharacterized membrane protein YecN with MAPEG domain